MRALFTKHPSSVNETYSEHMGSAFSFGATMVFAGAACLLHGIFPFVFQATGRNAVARLHDRMITHRIKREDGSRGPLQPAE